MLKSVLAASLLLAPAVASALVSLPVGGVYDGSFETPNLGVGNYSYSTQPSGWTGTGALVNAQGSSAWYGSTPPAGQDGNQFYALQSSSYLSQSGIFVKSGSVKVSWLAAGRPVLGGAAGDQSYTVSLAPSQSTFLGHTLLARPEFAPVTTFTTVSGQAFTQYSEIFSAPVSTFYTLTFQGLTTTDETAFIDGVSIGGVPEAATWAMMIAGFGLVGVGLRRRSAVA